MKLLPLFALLSCSVAACAAAPPDAAEDESSADLTAEAIATGKARDIAFPLDTAGGTLRISATGEGSVDVRGSNPFAYESLLSGVSKAESGTEYTLTFADGHMLTFDLASCRAAAPCQPSVTRDRVLPIPDNHFAMPVQANGGKKLRAMLDAFARRDAAAEAQPSKTFAQCGAHALKVKPGLYEGQAVIYGDSAGGGALDVIATKVIPSTLPSGVTQATIDGEGIEVVMAAGLHRTPVHHLRWDPPSFGDRGVLYYSDGPMREHDGLPSDLYLSCTTVDLEALRSILAAP